MTHDTFSADEKPAHEKLHELEYPRMVNWPDGSQTRVENAEEAKKAVAAGASLKAPDPTPDAPTQAPKAEPKVEPKPKPIEDDDEKKHKR